MSPRKHQKLFSGFLALAGIPALLLAQIVKPADAHAEGSSSYFDTNAAQCVVDNYNETTGSSVTEIERVDFSKITTLNCANRNITHFRGIVLFKNLETLDLSDNTSLAVGFMDFSQNTKLKTLDLYHAGNYWSLDLSHNPDIENLTLRPTSGYPPEVILAKGVEKLNDNDEFAYGLNLKDIKWLDPESTSVVDIDGTQYAYRIDDVAGQILFKDKGRIPYSIAFASGSPYNEIRVVTRSGYIHYRLFFEGDEEVESHNPIYLNNNCERIEGGVNARGDIDYYYSCDNVVYHGDEFDTDDLMENTLKKIFNLDAYELSKIEIVPPTAHVELTTDTDTTKKGKVLSGANFSLDFHFTLKSEDTPSDEPTEDSEKSDTPSAPNTGLFTTEDGSVNVANIAIIIAGLSILTFVALGLTRRLSARSRARKF